MAEEVFYCKSQSKNLCNPGDHQAVAIPTVLPILKATYKVKIYFLECIHYSKLVAN